MRKNCMVHALEYAWYVPNAIKNQERRNEPPNWVIRSLIVVLHVARVHPSESVCHLWSLCQRSCVSKPRNQCLERYVLAVTRIAMIATTAAAALYNVVLDGVR